MGRRALNVLTHRTFSLPLVVLMPHSRCNARCVMCDIWKANNERRDLTVDDLRPMLRTLERWQTRRVVFSGGEALMSENLWLFASMLRRADLKITLLSTGLTLARHAPDVARWCDEVVVSLDGSREVHDDIRNVPRAFDKLAEGVRAVKSERADIRVTARSVVQRKNFEDLPVLVDSAEAIGLDAVSLLPVDVSSQAFNRLPVWGQERVDETALTYDEVGRLETIVDKLIHENAERIDRGFIVEDRTKLRRIPQYFYAVLGHGSFPPVRCNAPWVSAVVEANGDVRPCFFHAPYGNIRDESLEALVNGPEAVAFRKNLDVAKDKTCQRCVCSLHVGLRGEV